MSEIDARTKAIGIISGGRVQALEDAGLMIVDKQEIDRLKEMLERARKTLQDAWEDEGSTTVGKQILESIKAIDELLKGE